ncbi:(+)-menthofuran synthase [Bertholletia excelsa]
MKSLYVLQLLSNKRVQSYSKIRLEETAIMVKKIRECSALRSPVNLSDLFESVTNNVISRAAFGKKYGEGERGEKFKQLLRELLELLSGPDIGELLPGCKWMSRINGYDAKMERVSKGLDEFLEGVVEGRMNSFSTESREAEEGDREDFLDILIRVYRDNKGGTSFDKDCIKALILTAFAGGTDTSATFLEWATTELLKHPRVLIKLQTEVRDVLKDRPEIMEDDLNKMHYLKAVIKEIFRLHPPIPLLVPRTAREDVRVMGYDLAAGTMVIINAWAIGRDPSLWDEAEEFRPERFLVSDIDFKGHDFQLIPFGAGRRGCPGISFAMVLNELVLANLVHKFDWELAGGVRAEDLDMTECPGATIHRKTPLVALATPYPC